jgi:hypothetical protein
MDLALPASQGLAAPAEPSSSTMSSVGCSVWPRTRSIEALASRAPLLFGMITEIAGGVVSAL